MKYKTLRFTLVSLLMMLCGTVFAGTITFGDLNLENGVQYSDPFDGGDFTVTFAGGGNDGKYYTTGAGIRVYGGGTMTVAAKSGNITSITVTYDGSNKPSNGDVVNVGTYNAETGEWTGEASSVVFTRPTGSGHWRVQSVTVTVSGGGDNPQPQTDVYTIAGTGDLTGTAEAWTIDDANKMTKNNEGLYVKTFNGITISADNQPQFKVVKNAGKDDETWYPEGDGSSNWVITPTYLGGDGIYDITITFNAETKIIGVSGVKTSWNTIAELNALQNNTAFTFFGEPLVVAKPTDKYVYIKDETGASLIYDASGEKTAAAEAGKTLAAPWTGKVSIFRSLFELVPDATLKVKDGDAVEVTYDEATTTDVTEENVNKVVIIKGLTISEINEKNITFAIGEATIAGYNQFGIELPEVTEGKTFDVVGAIGRYNDNIQFQPIKITEQVEETPEPDPEFYIVGNMTDWEIDANYKMTLNEALVEKGIKEFSLDMTLAAGAEFKAVSSTDGKTIKSCFPEGEGNNYTISEAGDYTIYFRPNQDGGDDWHYKVLYAAKKEAPATTYTVTVAETQNGQVEVNKTEAAEGETVSVTVTPAEGYMVDEAYWTYGEGENVTKTNIEEPSEGNAATFIMPAANVTVTVTFKAVAAEPVYYVVGTMNNWTPSDEYKMVLNEAAEGTEYMFTFDAEANTELKVKDAKGAWYPGDGTENFKLNDAGNYTIYFRPNADGGDNWYYQYIFAIKNESEELIRSWDFTQWSEETVANLKADAAASKLEGWSDVEKKADAEAGADPTEASKDNCFWYVGGEAEPTANGVAIAELKGLEFNTTYGANRSLAIAVNYPETSLGTYHGPSYLWFGGSKKDIMTIKNVKAGTTIKMGVESHKTEKDGGDARGVQLFVSNEGAHGDQLKDAEGNDVPVPVLYTEQEWAVPGTEGVVDIIVYNTNGCHIYFIDADIEYTYTVAGAYGEDVEGGAEDVVFGKAWDPTQTKNDMVKQEDGTYKLTITGVELQNDVTVYYKVVKNHSWDESWGFNGENANYKVWEGDGKYTITFTFDPNAEGDKVSCEMVKETPTGITMLKAAIENGTVYNMNGQKVNKAQKGLYIINGKKVVIK